MFKPNNLTIHLFRGKPKVSVKKYKKWINIRKRWDRKIESTRQRKKEANIPTCGVGIKVTVTEPPIYYRANQDAEEEEPIGVRSCREWASIVATASRATTQMIPSSPPRTTQPLCVPSNGPRGGEHLPPTKVNSFVRVPPRK